VKEPAVFQFPDGPRKRRTRQHVIADQSVNHVERFIIEAGHVMHRLANDYGYDLVMMTFDESGYAEPRGHLSAIEGVGAVGGKARNVLV
jgi:hypothetical protein